MSMGTDLVAFSDFMLQTGPAYMTGPEDLLNLASKQTFLMKRLIAKKSPKELLQGGATIKDQIMFAAESDFAHYRPNESFDYSNQQGVDEWSVNWRFTKDSMGWTHHEVGLNTAQMSKRAKIHKFKTLKRTKERRMWTSLMNKLDNTLIRQPDATEMELSNGLAPYSLPVFINEWSKANATAAEIAANTFPGLPSTVWSGVSSTIMGINPNPSTGKIAWNNMLESYSDVSTPASANLFRALSRLFHRLKWDSLPMKPELGEGQDWPDFIGTSLKGIEQYEHLLRISQDSFLAGRQDPSYQSPTFRGVQLVYLSDFDTAPIFRTGAGNTFGDESSALNIANNFGSGARYWCVRGESIKPIFHEERYFFKKKVELPRQPFNEVIVVDLWHNNICVNRRQNGMIYPSVNL